MKDVLRNTEIRVEFKRREWEVWVGRYEAPQNIIIRLYKPGLSAEQMRNSASFYTATVNPNFRLIPGLIWIKDCDENAGIAEALEEARVIEVSGLIKRFGSIDVNVARILIPVTLDTYEYVSTLAEGGHAIKQMLPPTLTADLMYSPHTRLFNLTADDIKALLEGGVAQLPIGHRGRVFIAVTPEERVKFVTLRSH